MADQLKGKTILVVDDDPDVLTALTTLLGETGATILSAADGNAAVEVAEKSNPDVVILDMMLPKRSGFLVLERIKKGKTKKDKPHVIMITGNLGTRHKSYAETLGVVDYINKPFRVDRLMGAIDKALGTATAPAAPAAPAGS